MNPYLYREMRFVTQLLCSPPPPPPPLLLSVSLVVGPLLLTEKWMKVFPIAANSDDTAGHPINRFLRTFGYDQSGGVQNP